MDFEREIKRLKRCINCNTDETSSSEYVTKKVITSVDDFLIDHTVNGDNEIILQNLIYEIDAFELDLGIYTLRAENINVAFHGYSSNINIIKTLLNNANLFTFINSNVEIRHLQLSAPGTNSQCIFMQGTGVEAIDMYYITFGANSKFGTLIDIRQGFMTTAFAQNAREGFTLDGDSSLGGFTIRPSKFINVDKILEATSAYRALNVRLSVNADLLVGQTAFDFDYNNFLVDGGYQIFDGAYNGAGTMVADFSDVGRDTDIASNSKKSFFSNNEGDLGQETNPGCKLDWTTSTPTPLVLNTETKLLGTTSISQNVHFIQSDNNEIQRNVGRNKYFTAHANISLIGTAGDTIKLVLQKYDDSTGTWINIVEDEDVIVNLPGTGNDAVTFNLSTSIELDELDLITAYVTNLTNSNAVTPKLTSHILLVPRN